MEKDFMELLTLPTVSIEGGLLLAIKYLDKTINLHRNIDLGPVIIGYYKDGKIKYKQYCVNGKNHRLTEEGPAVIWYYEDGQNMV